MVSFPIFELFFIRQFENPVKKVIENSMLFNYGKNE